MLRQGVLQVFLPHQGVCFKEGGGQGVGAQEWYEYCDEYYKRLSPASKEVLRQEAKLVAVRGLAFSLDSDPVYGRGGSFYILDQPQEGSDAEKEAAGRRY